MVILIGSFGIIGNLIAIPVLMKTEMKSSINYIFIGKLWSVFRTSELTSKLYWLWINLGLAILDSLIVLTVILLRGMPSVVGSLYQVYSFPYLYPTMNIAWTASIYLTVLMSFQQFLGVCHQDKSGKISTPKKTIIYIVVTIIFSCIYNTPRFQEYELVDILTRTDYDLDMSEFETLGYDTWYKKAYANVTVVKETNLIFNNIYVTYYLTWINFFVRFCIPTTLLIFFNFKILSQVNCFGYIGPTQLLNATFKDVNIDNYQVLKYQPSVTSRVIFHHLIPLMMIKYWNIRLDVTDAMVSISELADRQCPCLWTRHLVTEYGYYI